MKITKQEYEWLIDDIVGLAIAGASTSGARQRQWFLDQIIRSVMGDGYDDFVEYCASDENGSPIRWGTGVAPE